MKRGGVGLYIKYSLPSRDRSDLATFPECIVREVQVYGKKYFFAVIYRSLSQNQTEFDDFTMNFELLLSKMAAENPFCVVITVIFQFPLFSVVGKRMRESRGVLICFSVRGRAAEQGVIFRVPTPGQGIIFVKIGSMTGSIFVIFDSERSF